MDISLYLSHFSTCSNAVCHAIQVELQLVHNLSNVVSSICEMKNIIFEGQTQLQQFMSQMETLTFQDIQ